MEDKNINIELANLYKAGNSGVDIDEADFWIWKRKMEVSNIEFILESGDKLICSNAGDLWNMDPTMANDCKVIDTTEGYCPECKFLNKCSKKAEIDQLRKDISDNSEVQKIQ